MLLQKFIQRELKVKNKYIFYVDNGNNNLLYFWIYHP